MDLKKLNVVNLNTTDIIGLHSSYFPLFITLFWNIIFCEFFLPRNIPAMNSFQSCWGFVVAFFSFVENVKTFYIASSECGKE